VLLIGIAVLWLSHAFQKAILQPLAPVLGDILATFDSDVKVLSVGLGHEGPNETVSFRVNLAHPVDIGGRTVYPYGTHSIPDGSMEVNIGAAYLLQYTVLLLVVVLAWPPDNVREWLLRLLLSLPFMAAVLIVPGPSTALALVWGPFHQELDPGAFWPVLTWSRFLSGGGGIAITLVMAAIAIGVARWRASYS
jgi:hypothetical protein